VRRANRAKESLLEKNNQGVLSGPGKTLDKDRKVAEMITGQVNQAILQLGRKINIFS